MQGVPYMMINDDRAHSMIIIYIRMHVMKNKSIIVVITLHAVIPRSAIFSGTLIT